MIVWDTHWERESGVKQRRQLRLSPHLQPNDKGRNYKGTKMLKRGSERQGIVSSQKKPQEFRKREEAHKVTEGYLRVLGTLRLRL